MKKIYSNKILLLSIVTIILLLALPYYLFEGKLFIGGDDTRLFYAYPYEFLKNVSFFSWYNFSSYGFYNPNQFSLPLTAFWSLLFFIIKSRVVIDYLAFSLPLILGFIYFQKLAKNIIRERKHDSEIFIGSLIYILSPILALNQLSIFLYAAWLIGLLPIISYYFLSYLQTGNYSFILRTILFCVISSIALVAIPWALGYFLPITAGLLASAFLYKRRTIFIFLKRFFIFFSLIFFSQAFWLLPFLSSFIGSDNSSYGEQVLSEQTTSTFSGTVLATATGSILFPLLNLFHRTIAFDFNWQLKNTYEVFYDRLFFINTIYLVIFFCGLLLAKKVLIKNELKKFITVFAGFLISLFLFTVSIGPLKYLFLLFGNIPGFAMFRNFYDKFALGYTLIYSLLLTYSLVIIAKKFPRIRYITALVLFTVLLINFLSVKNVVVKPVWQQKDIYTNITIPDEYLNFMNQVQKNVSNSSSILSIPYNIASYTFIKDSTSGNVYSGTSPIKVFTGINDYSGDLSFPTNDQSVITTAIKERDYKEILRLLQKYNISYIIVTKNIPKQIKMSYLFNKDTLKAQDEEFIESVSDKLIIESSNGNYLLYSIKRKNSLMASKDILFKKINPVKYKFYIKSVEKPQKLIMNDSFHSGWKLFLVKNPTSEWCDKREYFDDFKTTECRGGFSFFELSDMLRSFQSGIFTDSHKRLGDFGNQWIIDPSGVYDNFDSQYYKLNADGSYDIELELYFVPQNYFYFGTVITFFAIIYSTMWMIRNKSKESK